VTLVDLIHQVQKALPVRFGGTGVTTGEARGVVLMYQNVTGSTIALYSTVQRRVGNDDGRVELTSAAESLAFLGIVVGRGVSAGNENYGSWEPIAPADGDMVAVLISGRTTVLVSGAVTRGQFLSTSSTAGKAHGTSTTPLIGTFGVVEKGGSSSCVAVIGGGLGTAQGAKFVTDGGAAVVDNFTTIDFGEHLEVRADGSTAVVDVDPSQIYLDADRVFVEDVGNYYTPTAPGSGTETLRPSSDVTKSGTITYTSGTTGWNLVDEAVLDTADNYLFGAFNCFLIHGFPASALAVDQAIDSVTLVVNALNNAPASTVNAQVRDPATGTRYTVSAMGQNGGVNDMGVVLTTRPWDSQPWTLEDVQNLQAGFLGPTSGAANLRVRQFYLEVNWTRRITVESALDEIGSGAVGGGVADILDLPTAETDTTLVLAPDGAGGVEFRAETGGGGSVAAPGFIGAKAYNSATQTVNNTTASLTLDSEEFDTDGFHSTSSNTERMTIPAGMGGKYLIAYHLHVPPTTVANPQSVAWLRKNGSTTLRGSSLGTNIPVSANDLESFDDTATVVTELAAGDYIDIQFFTNDNLAIGHATGEYCTSLSIFKLDSGKVGSGIGAYASSSGTTNLGTGSYTAIALAAADTFDTDGFHDPASNNTRMTIPAGLGGKYLVTAQAQIANSGSAITDKRVAINKNGGGTILLVREYVSTIASTTIYLDGSVVMDLAAGDYIEMMGFCDVASSTGAGTLSIMRLDSGTSAYTGARWGSGTAFPSGPSTGDRYTRTDLDPRDYFWDGTRWLSETVYEMATSQQNISATTDSGFYAAVGNSASKMWMIDFRVMYQVSTTHSGTQYWTMQLWDASSGAIAAFLATTSKSGTSMQTIGPTAVGAVHPGSTLGFYVHAIKVSTPGVLLYSYIVRYRIIAT
jgi:hypothetical protein